MRDKGRERDEREIYREKEREEKLFCSSLLPCKI